MKTRHLVLAATAALGLAAAVPALAQGWGGGFGHGGRGGFGPGGGAMRHVCTDTDARLAGFLAFGEARLAITEAQRPAWTAFAEAARSAAEPVKQLCADTGGQAEAKTLPEGVDRLEQGLTAALESVRRIGPALDELYAVLTPEQQATANQLLEHGGHRRGSGGNGRRG